jgi:hypothetical protein
VICSWGWADGIKKARPIISERAVNFDDAGIQPCLN